jgi:hypothetical protein
METINTLELIDESVYPDEKVLKNVLGDSYSAYYELLQVFDSKKMEGEWRYYKDGKAWLCKVQYKKKTIVWMSAWKGLLSPYKKIIFHDSFYCFHLPQSEA